MRRTLIHFWRMNLAVTAGAAIAAAVLTGALLVGDSVRSSLRQITLERLGAIDHALAGQRFFSEEVAERVAEPAEFRESFGQIAPAILLQGSAENATSGARAATVNLQGIDERFLRFFSAEDTERVESFFNTEGPMIFPPVVLNHALAEELGVEIGEAILISLKRWSAVPRGSLLGRKDTSSVVERLRLTVQGILDDRELGSFGLTAHQSLPHNAFVPLAALQKALDQPGSINGLLVAAKESPSGPEDAARLDTLLSGALDAEDLSLTLTAEDDFLVVESEELVLRPALADTLLQIAEEQRTAVWPIMTYLANKIRVGELEVPYSTVSAVDTSPDAAFGTLTLIDGTPAPTLSGNELLLNQVTAEELDAKPGDEVELTYFVVGPREELSETTHTFKLRGIVAMEGLGADRSLSQEVPGIADADNMADWDPPFPLDLGRVRSSDEEYWDLYRATPRAFVALEKGQELWRSRWGDLTSVRLATPADSNSEAFAEKIRHMLPERTEPAGYGLTFQPVKAFGLQASSGATDFSGLFIGFSQFLILSAALLAALLFSLGVEQRAEEIGLRLAIGFQPKKIRRMLLAEGAGLAVIGSLIGLLGASGYAALLMAGLRTWWREAVGTSRLELFITPTSLILGFAISVLVILFAIWRAVRRVGNLPAVALLAKNTEPMATRPGRRARWITLLASGASLLLLLYALASGQTANPALFFALGPCVLIALLAWFALSLGTSARAGRNLEMSTWRLVTSQAGRNRGRSLLSTSLVAVACFMIATVAAYHQDFRQQDLDKDSGTGGFSLVAESDIELHQDLSQTEGRYELGLSEATRDLLDGVDVHPLKLLPGDDTSCLNLYQPSQPRLLGIPQSLIERGGFTFAQTLVETDRPWTLLEQELEPGVIPAIGDMNSTMWILKLKLGEELTLEDEAGNPIRLRLVGTLSTSLFQSELLIPESAFLRHFPSRSGASYFLLETPTEQARDIATALEDDLGNYGFDAMASGDKLAAFHAVQNTYLSTFQTLGGLGLLLGTIGLAVILARNALERRGELATLQAFGFKKPTLTRLVVFENALLLLAGLGIGTLSALVAVAPHLASDAARVPWIVLLGTLGGIFLFGLLACALTASFVLRAPLLPALKSE